MRTPDAHQIKWILEAGPIQPAEQGQSFEQALEMLDPAERERVLVFSDSIIYLEGKSPTNEYKHDLAAASLEALGPYCQRENKTVFFHYGSSNKFQSTGISDDPFGSYRELPQPQGDVFEEIRVGASRDLRQIPSLIFHEFGHAFNGQLKKIAQENKRQLCTNRHTWEHLISCAVLYPEFLSPYQSHSNPLIRDTLWCLQRLVQEAGLDQVKDKILPIVNQEAERLSQQLAPILAQNQDIAYAAAPWLDPEDQFIPFGTEEAILSLLLESGVDLEEELADLREKRGEFIDIQIKIIEHYLKSA